MIIRLLARQFFFFFLFKRNDSLLATEHSLNHVRQVLQFWDPSAYLPGQSEGISGLSK